MSLFTPLIVEIIHSLDGIVILCKKPPRSNLKGFQYQNWEKIGNVLTK